MPTFLSFKQTAYVAEAASQILNQEERSGPLENIRSTHNPSPARVKCQGNISQKAGDNLDTLDSRFLGRETSTEGSFSGPKTCEVATVGMSPMIILQDAHVARCARHCTSG